MSTAAFPTLKGQSWPIKRTQIWQTRQQESVSGRQLSFSDWSFPRWQWDLTFSFLRGYQPTQTELLTLQAFFNSRAGRSDSFLYTDNYDYYSTGSTIATGDSTLRNFQLTRTIGIAEPIYAPTSVNSVYLGTSLVTSTQYTWNAWGTTSPGYLLFSTKIPTSTQPIIVDFAYAWPCTFNDDRMTYEQFVKYIWENKTVSFTSLK